MLRLRRYMLVSGSLYCCTISCSWRWLWWCSTALELQHIFFIPDYVTAPPLTIPKIISDAKVQNYLENANSTDLRGGSRRAWQAIQAYVHQVFMAAHDHPGPHND